MSTFCENRRPEISYPCRWEYRIIGEDEVALRAAVAMVAGDRAHTVAHSRASGGGRYLSLAVEIAVDNDNERLAVFAALREHPHIRWVL